MTIEVIDLTFGFGGHIVLDRVSVSFAMGSLHILTGNNGVGKSSLFKIFTGIYTEYSGHILIDNHDIRAYSIADFARQIALFTATQPKSSIWGREVFEFSNIDPEILIQVSDEYDLKPLMDRKLSQLSDGQLQWLFLIRAIALDRPIILLDEPTSFLDQSKRNILKKLISSLISNRKIVILATHDIDLISIPNAVKWHMADFKIYPVTTL